MKFATLAAAVLAGVSNAQSSSADSSDIQIGFDPEEWEEFDAAAIEFDAAFLGNYEGADTSGITDTFEATKTVALFDLGSTASSFRRRGSVVTLSEIRAIWNELSPIVEDNDGIVVKSVGDTLVMLFDDVADGLTASHEMYLALVARWRRKVAEACDTDPEDWCAGADEEEERKRFYNTMAAGAGYGDMLLIPASGEGHPIDLYGPPVNNAFFSAEEEAEHGEFRIDEGAMQRLLVEAGVATQDGACDTQTVTWTPGTFDIQRFIVRQYFGGAFCYYTVCFDDECKIPDDE